MSEPTAPYSNPTTSLAAAESLEPVLSFLENKVLAFINARGDYGATCFEVEAGLALPHQTASARINGPGHDAHRSLRTAGPGVGQPGERPGDPGQPG
jgi:hypothetical protein